MIESTRKTWDLREKKGQPLVVKSMSRGIPGIERTSSPGIMAAVVAEVVSGPDARLLDLPSSNFSCSTWDTSGVGVSSEDCVFVAWKVRDKMSKRGKNSLFVSVRDHETRHDFCWMLHASYLLKDPHLQWQKEKGEDTEEDTEKGIHVTLTVTVKGRGHTHTKQTEESRMEKTSSLIFTSFIPRRRDFTGGFFYSDWLCWLLTMGRKIRYFFNNLLTLETKKQQNHILSLKRRRHKTTREEEMAMQKQHLPINIHWTTKQEEERKAIDREEASPGCHLLILSPLTHC